MTTFHRAIHHRAAAAKAGQKIQRAFAIWNDFDEDEASVSQSSIFDETDGLELTNKHVMKPSCFASKNSSSTQSTKSNSSSPSKPEPRLTNDEDEAEDSFDFQEEDTVTEEERVATQKNFLSAYKRRIAYQKGRAVRMLHSNGPMQLSKRTAYRMARKGPESPNFSPVRPTELNRAFKHSKIKELVRSTRKSRVVITFK